MAIKEGENEAKGQFSTRSYIPTCFQDVQHGPVM